ncbi:MAG: hypothetical protein R3C11_13520 [Planctomycetaceae bacterium]
MIHGDVSLFVEDEVWYLMVHADCQHLLENNMAVSTIPAPRFAVTIRPTTVSSTLMSVTKVFETADQVWEYAETVSSTSSGQRK